MRETLPAIHFPDRPKLRSLLGMLLPQSGPVARLECFAQSVGYSSDEEFRACTRPPLEDCVFTDSLSWSVGQGVVLPLLIRAGADLEAPTLDAILDRADDMLNPAIALQSPAPILETLRDIPQGAPRQFYARVMRRLLFTTLNGGDLFWPSKAGSAFEGLAAMADEIPAGAALDEELVAYLVERPSHEMGEAMRKGQRQLRALHEAPAMTRSSILMSLTRTISRREIEVKQSHYLRKMAA